jgi:hypothetical protein
MKRIILVICLCPFFLSSQISSDSVKSKMQRFAGVYITPSMRGDATMNLSKEKFSLIWPELLNPQYKDYAANQQSGFSFGLADWEAGVSFHNNCGTKNTQMRRFQTNVGLSLARHYTQSALLKITERRTDTTFASNGSAVSFRDSVTEDHLILSYTSQYLGLQVGETFNTDLSKAISFFAGLNLSAAYSINPQVSETRMRVLWANETDATSGASTPSPVEQHNFGGYSHRSTKVNTASYVGLLTLSTGANIRLFWIRKEKACVMFSPALFGGVKMTFVGSTSNQASPVGGMSLAIRCVFL